MRLYDRHTQIFISYDTVVPDKTKFVSLLHERQTDTQTDTLTQTDTITQTDRQTDRHSVTLKQLCCV